MGAKLETLLDIRSGVYVVTTSGGTRHVVDLERGSATRYGAPGRAWGHHSSPDGAADGEPFYFTRIQDAAVGERMYLFSKGGYVESDYWRLTSAVASIEEMTFDLASAQAAWGIDDEQLAVVIGCSAVDIERWKSSGVSVERRGAVIDYVMATEVLSKIEGASVETLVREENVEGLSILEVASGETSVVLYALAMSLASEKGSFEGVDRLS